MHSFTLTFMHACVHSFVHSIRRSVSQIIVFLQFTCDNVRVIIIFSLATIVQHFIKRQGSNRGISRHHNRSFPESFGVFRGSASVLRLKRVVATLSFQHIWKRPVFSAILWNLGSATSSNSNKPQTANGKYLREKMSAVRLAQCCSTWQFKGRTAGQSWNMQPYLWNHRNGCLLEWKIQRIPKLGLHFAKEIEQ